MKDKISTSEMQIYVNANRCKNYNYFAFFYCHKEIRILTVDDDFQSTKFIKYAVDLKVQHDK